MAMMVEICKAALVSLLHTFAGMMIGVMIFGLIIENAAFGLSLLAAIGVYVLTGRLLAAIEAEDDPPGEGAADE